MTDAYASLPALEFLIYHSKAKVQFCVVCSVFEKLFRFFRATKTTATFSWNMAAAMVILT